VKLGWVFALSGLALLLLASSLLADDRSAEVREDTNPDSTADVPASMVGVAPSFSLEEEPDFKHSPAKSVFLSTILPGLGQAENGQWAKATAFVVVGSMLVTKIVVESQRADRYLDLSRSATTDLEAELYYQSYLDRFDRRDRLVWWTVGFWVYNMFDAYIDGHLFGFSRQ
jgi:hypothetical protein